MRIKQPTRNDIGQEIKGMLKKGLQNKTVDVMLIRACIVLGLVLLFVISIFSDTEQNESVQIAKINYHDHPSLIATALPLQLEKDNMQVEHELAIRHDGWIAGSAKSIP